jgi:hypothetical protein
VLEAPPEAVLEVEDPSAVALRTDQMLEVEGGAEAEHLGQVADHAKRPHGARARGMMCS